MIAGLLLGPGLIAIAVFLDWTGIWPQNLGYSNCVGFYDRSTGQWEGGRGRNGSSTCRFVPSPEREPGH